MPPICAYDAISFSVSCVTDCSTRASIGQRIRESKGWSTPGVRRLKPSFAEALS
jgi:hypothetical protein